MLIGQRSADPVPWKSGLRPESFSENSHWSPGLARLRTPLINHFPLGSITWVVSTLSGSTIEFVSNSRSGPTANYHNASPSHYLQEFTAVTVTVTVTVSQVSHVPSWFFFLLLAIDIAVGGLIADHTIRGEIFGVDFVFRDFINLKKSSAKSK